MAKEIPRPQRAIGTVIHQGGPRRPSWSAICSSVLLLLLCAGMPFAHAAPRPLLTPFGDFAIRAPALPAGAGSPDFYAASGPDPGWQIVQWDIPGGRLSSFRNSRDGAVEILTSTAPEALVRLRRSPDTESIALVQDGAALPCVSADGKPRESDLFFSPKDRSTPGPSALTSGLVPIAQLQSLVLDTTLTVRLGMTARPKGCTVNQGTAVAAVVLTDRAAHPAQTLFYQLALAFPCGPGPASRVRQCEGGTRAAWFFSPHNPFGAADYLAKAGEPYLKSGERRSLRLDLLPRISKLIAAAPEKMDHDPTHWAVNNFYAGQHIWGDFAMASTWERFQVIAYPK
jgi:hypothetical protein